MGKPSSKIIELLVITHQPKRYVVTNNGKILLVTYDHKTANILAENTKIIHSPQDKYTNA